MFFFDLILASLSQVWVSFTHNWPFLVISVVVGVILKQFLDQKKAAAFLMRYRRAGVLASTAVAVTTPLCSCGTTAVVLGMMAGRMPWAPIVAFMVASPLTSPEGLIYSAGLFGWPFAWAFYIASIALGLLGGFAAYVMESRGWLKNQTRFQTAPAAAAFSPDPVPASPERKKTVRVLAGDAIRMGSQLLFFFFTFAFVGYVLNGLIPQEWVTAVFGGGRIYGVPLAATFGIPFYVNSEASLPLVRAMLDTGMSQGAALAFLITGAGTSLGALAGLLTIARWRVVGLVIGTLWVGAVVSGFAFNLISGVGL
ncbi:MAG: permease [Anaerolineales bacterium]